MHFHGLIIFCFKLAKTKKVRIASPEWEYITSEPQSDSDDSSDTHLAWNVEMEIQQEADHVRIDKLEETVAQLKEEQQTLWELLIESRRRLDAYAQYSSNLYDDIWDLKDMAMRLEDDNMTSNIFRLTQQQQMESDD
jgi:hypothetical protein